MKFKNPFESPFAYLGVFFFIDGIASIFFGHACLNSCYNNNMFGDSIRILRAIGGLALIAMSSIKK